MVYTVPDLDALPITAGVYVFGRISRGRMIPMYVGQAMRLRSRIRTQLNNARLMLGIANSPGRRRVLVLGELVARPGQELNARIRRIRPLATSDKVRRQLFDRSSDPFELEDLAETRPDSLPPLRAALDAALASQRARGESLRSGEMAPPPVADPELRAQLCALGYVDDDCSPRQAAP